jgi:sugar lactone lactonase YvrE
MTLPTVEVEPETSAGSAEALIEEARRRQRRRWLLVAGIAAIVAVVIATVTTALAGEGGPTPLPHPRLPAGQRAPVVPAAGTQPKAPGSLAAGPGGVLYVADDTRHQILERLPNGRFRIVAGNRTAGFSGDGGPAVDAEIDDPGGMAVAPDGTLYFADIANARVRAVSSAGIITTVAGNGRPGWVADGTPADDAPLLDPTAVTFSPSGQLYIADGEQVLVLDADGTLTGVLGNQSPEQGLVGVGGPATDASADGAEGLAFDAAGDLFVFGFGTKSILMVDPRGMLTSLPDGIYPRGYGGLVSASDGTVLAMGATSVVRLSPAGEQTLVTFPHRLDGADRFLGVRNFSPAGIATAPDGTIYVDTNPDGGFANTSAIAAIAPSGRPSLLWRGTDER